MDSLEKFSVSKMKEAFQVNYDERVKMQKTYSSVEDFSAVAQKSGDMIRENLKGKEQFVENQIFSGDLEKEARESSYDFAHNYVYEEAQETVSLLNKEMSEKIAGFKSANLEEHSLLEVEKPLENSINKRPKAAGWKQRMSENSTLKSYKAINPRADINTVRELKTLNKYNELRENFIEVDENKNFKNELFANAERDLEINEKEKTGRGKYYLKHGLLPFMKIYKKGWFGRKYTIDGKRIEEKPGEQTYDEYNREFIETMTLDTEFESKSKSGEAVEANKDPEVIQKNRQKKGRFIMNLAKELMDYRVTGDMLTDEYLAEHVGMMQQYLDKLNAFRVIVQENPWVFNTNKTLDKQLQKTGLKQYKVIDDEYLENLIETRIFRVADRLNIFMDEHYAAHGMQRLGRFSLKKNGMLVGEKPLLRNLDKTDIDKIKEENKYKDEIEAFNIGIEERKKNQERNATYRSEQILNSINPIMLVDAQELQEKGEKDEYIEKAEMASQNLEANLKEVTKGLKLAYKESTRLADKVLEEYIGETLDGYKDRIIKETGELVAPIKMLIEGTSEMYLLYGPEIEQLYSKLYASTRLSAELRARKDAINSELEKMKNNGTAFTYQTKNIYAASLNDYFSKDLQKHAENSSKIIDDKLEVTTENLNIIKKTMMFFLRGPQDNDFSWEDLKQIKGYLEKENLGHMFEVTKLDSYKELMDDVMLEVDKETAKLDNGDANVDEIKKAGAMTSKERALNIYRVRNRVNAQKALNAGFEKAEATIKEEERDGLKAMLYKDTFDISRLDFKGEFPVGDEEQVIGTYKLHLTELAAKELKDNEVRYDQLMNYSKMKVSYQLYHKEAMKNHKEVPKKDVFWYMASTRAKVDILAEHSEVTEALKNIRQNHSYPYFDMSRILAMPLDELGRLEEKLEAKKSDLLKQLDGLGDAFTEEKAKLKDMIAGTDDMLTMTKEYQKVKEFEKKYPVLSDEVISNKAREYYEEIRLEDAQKEFIFADKKYLKIEDILTDEVDQKEIENNSNWKNHIERNKEKFGSADVERELLSRCEELMKLPLDESVEALKRLKNAKNPEQITRDDVIKTFNRGNAIQTLARIFNGKKKTDLEKEMLEIMAKPAHKELYAAVLKKLAVLEPLGEAIKSFAASYDLNLVGKKNSWHDWGENSELSQEKIKEEWEASKADTEQKLNEFEEISKKYESGEVDRLVAEAEDEVLDDLYKNGEKFSILDLDKWKAKIEEMVSKDLKSQKSKNKAYWHRLAAMNILAHWSYAFEQFYAKRIAQDTHLAFSLRVKELLGKDGADILSDEQIEKTIEISKFVSEQEASVYFALDENDTKELDRALEANGYDKKIFKQIFRKVKVNSVGMPLDEDDRWNREVNADIAKHARNFFALTAEEKKQSAKDNAAVKYFGRDLRANLIRPIMESRHIANLNDAMLTEEYIGENFKELYPLAQKIGCMDDIYQKNSACFTKEGLLDCKEYEEVKLFLDDSFGTKKNRMMKRFKEMIDAYAKKNFVDETGAFDLGLSAEDLVILDGSRKERKLEKAEKKKRYQKVIDAVNGRNKEFEKKRSDVDAELNRVKIAQHTAQSAEGLKVIDNIQIGNADKIFSIVRFDRNGGHISDFGLLVQDKEMMEYVRRYEGVRQNMENAASRVDELQIKVDEFKTANKDVPPEVLKELENAQTILFQQNEQLIKNRTEIEGYKTRASEFYRTYQSCHNKDGKLVMEKKAENGKKIDLTDTYISFHAQVASDMSDIFNGFADMYKKYGDKIMEEKFIADLMKQDNWGEIYTGYKRFNLYGSILQREEETKKFWDFSKNSLPIRRLEAKTDDLKKKLKTKEAEAKKITQDFVAVSDKISGPAQELYNINKNLTENQNKVANPETNPEELNALVMEIQSLSLRKPELEQQIAELNKEAESLAAQKTAAESAIPILMAEISSHEKAAQNLKELFSKDTKTVTVFQDFVTQVERVLLRYGVREDGELFEDNLMRQVEGLTDDEKTDAAHEMIYKTFEVVMEGEKTDTK